MTTKLYNNIMTFSDNVGKYILMEYDESYHEDFNKNNLHMFDFIGSYYMGGANIPDTARQVVELIKMRKNGMA